MSISFSGVRLIRAMSPESIKMAGKGGDVLVKLDDKMLGLHDKPAVKPVRISRHQLIEDKYCV